MTETVRDQQQQDAVREQDAHRDERGAALSSVANPRRTSL